VQGEVARVLLRKQDHTLSNVVRGAMGSMSKRSPLGSELVCLVSCQLRFFVYHSTACPRNLKVLLHFPGFQCIPECISQVSMDFFLQYGAFSNHGRGGRHLLKHDENCITSCIHEHVSHCCASGGPVQHFVHRMHKVTVCMHARNHANKTSHPAMDSQDTSAEISCIRTKQ
jgi:hypothetical protein